MSGDATRERILETAWDLVRAEGAAVRMADVAAGSGVSRQMVYLHFRDRAGLLTAMARDHDRRSGFVERIAAAAELPEPQALERFVREWCAYIPEILPVARQLHAAALTGGPGGEAWHDRMAGLYAGLHALIARLARTGRLAHGWDVDAAADWAWARIHMASYLALVEDRGWTHDEFVERAVRSLGAELVAGAPG